jgi:hypothetical protein
MVTTQHASEEKTKRNSKNKEKNIVMGGANIVQHASETPATEKTNKKPNTNKQKNLVVGGDNIVQHASETPATARPRPYYPEQCPRYYTPSAPHLHLFYLFLLSDKNNHVRIIRSNAPVITLPVPRISAFFIYFCYQTKITTSLLFGAMPPLLHSQCPASPPFLFIFVIRQK